MSFLGQEKYAEKLLVKLINSIIDNITCGNLHDIYKEVTVEMRSAHLKVKEQSVMRTLLEYDSKKLVREAALRIS